MRVSLLYGGICLLLGILAAIWWARKKTVSEEAPEAPADTDPLPEEPDERIIVNPLRMNEPEGSILLYRKEGILVYGTHRIPLDSIREITFLNVANPYLPGEYHILLKLPDGEKPVHVPAGMDVAYVQETVRQLRDAIEALEK